MRDFLVGPSAAPSNGNIADGRIWWRCPDWEVEKFEEYADESGQNCSISTVGYQKASLLAKRHHYCREFRSINDFILRNWGACVDTVFGHVPRIGRV